MFATQNAGHKFVAREPITDYDFDDENLIFDNDYHDLDLSSIVPKGNILLLIQYKMGYENSNKYLKLRKKGYTTDYEAFVVAVTNGVLTNRGFCLIECNADRVIECNLSPDTDHFTGLIVQGWFV